MSALCWARWTSWNRRGTSMQNSVFTKWKASFTTCGMKAATCITRFGTASFARCPLKGAIFCFPPAGHRTTPGEHSSRAAGPADGRRCFLKKAQLHAGGRPSRAKNMRRRFCRPVRVRRPSRSVLKSSGCPSVSGRGGDAAFFTKNQPPGFRGAADRLSHHWSLSLSWFHEINFVVVR